VDRKSRATRAKRGISLRIAWDYTPLRWACKRVCRDDCAHLTAETRRKRENGPMAHNSQEIAPAQIEGRGQALDRVTTMTVPPRSAARRKPSCSAANTASSSPQTRVLIGPRYCSRSWLSNARQKPSIAGPKSSCPSGYRLTWADTPTLILDSSPPIYLSLGAQPVR